MKWFLLSLTLLLHCGPHHPPVTVVVGETDCQAAERRLTELQCHDRRGRPLWVNSAGQPFQQVCVQALADGRDWQPACIAKVPSCDDVDRAYRSSPCPY